MLRLGGATAQALQHATHWRCPTCVESAPPKRYLQATPEIRPFGFNKVLVLDLKYLKDAEHDPLAVLSMVDAGTAWHAACFVKNRTTRHIGRKLLSEWF